MTPWRLAADVFARLHFLMSDLPDDGHRVPPPNRRIVVSVHWGGRSSTRLYNSARLPGSIIEIIRLTGARIQVAAPELEPDKVLESNVFRVLPSPPPARWENVLAISPDSTAGVRENYEAKVLTVYQRSGWLDSGSPEDAKTLRVIPETWQPSNGHWGVSGMFSPDGRSFLVRWGGRVGVLLYDTRTWQPVTNLRMFPQHIREYLPSPDWTLGIAVSDAGEAMVWNQKARRVQSKLPGLETLEAPSLTLDRFGHRVYDEPSGEVLSAAFSPDRKRAVIYSGSAHIDELRLSIWDIVQGRKLRDLWPVAWMSYPGRYPNGESLWWNNGRWIIAPYTSRYASSGVGLWNADTGRYLGTLSAKGCDRQEGPVLLKNTLVQLCLGKENTTILYWSVAGVQRQLKEAADDTQL